MADTGTSKKATRAESEAAIRAMRAGGAAEGDKPKKSKKKFKRRIKMLSKTDRSLCPRNSLINNHLRPPTTTNRVGI